MLKHPVTNHKDIYQVESPFMEDNIAITKELVVKRPKIADHYIIILLSLVMTAFNSIAFIWPHLADADSLEAFYAGSLLSDSFSSYQDIFVTGGFLYYVIITLSYFLGSHFLLLGINFFSYYLSGFYLYKIIYSLTNYRWLGLAMTLIFYLFNLLFGFSGIHSPQWVMPFLIILIWLILRYLYDDSKDEMWIFYGVLSAIGFFIDSRLLLFTVLTVLFVGLYTAKHRFVAKGFYQFLCYLFGNLLVTYTFGYFIFNNQLLLTYLRQAIAIPFNLFQGEFWFSMGYHLLLFIGTGLWIALQKIKTSIHEDAYLLSMLKISMCLYFVFSLGSPLFKLSETIFLLPFALIVIAYLLKINYENQLLGKTQRRRRYRSSLTYFLLEFFKKTGYLSILLLFILSAVVGYHYATTSQHYQERRLISEKLQKESVSSIYVWDKTPLILLSIQQRPVSKWLAPLTAQRLHLESQLEEELLQKNAEFFVHYKNEPLTVQLQKYLEEQYHRREDLSQNHLDVYEFKETYFLEKKES